MRRYLPSEQDPSIYVCQGCTILTYIDDVLVFAKDNKTIDNFYTSLAEGLLVTDKGRIDKN